MKSLSKIIVAITTLILLAFGTSGLVTVKCSCTGKTSLVLPTGDNCCPRQSSCMDIKLWKVSDYEAASEQVTTSEQSELTLFVQMPYKYTTPLYNNLFRQFVYKTGDPPPSGGATTVAVLRV